MTMNTQEKGTKTVAKRVKISDDTQIKVKSNYHGTLFYKNKRNGDTVEWKNAGEIQPMSMGNLRAMKAEQADFFRNQWVIILGVDEYEDCKATCEDVCKALVVEQYYKTYIDPTDYAALSGLSEKEIKERVAMLSSGAKENLIVALNTFIKNGTLDSIRKIKIFEETLGCKLYENEE